MLPVTLSFFLTLPALPTRCVSATPARLYGSAPIASASSTSTHPMKSSALLLSLSHTVRRSRVCWSASGGVVKESSHTGLWLLSRYLVRHSNTTEPSFWIFPDASDLSLYL